MADGMAAECPVATEEYTQSRNNLRATRPLTVWPAPTSSSRMNLFLQTRVGLCEPSSKVIDSRELFKSKRRDAVHLGKFHFKLKWEIICFRSFPIFGNIKYSFEIMHGLWIFTFVRNVYERRSNVGNNLIKFVIHVAFTSNLIKEITRNNYSATESYS